MSNQLVFLILAMSLLTGCSRSEAQESVYRKISAQDAYKMMSELEDYVLLDVRTEAEYKEGHIPGALLIPFNEILSLAEKKLPDKNKTIFVYCRSGGRSANAVKELASLGYTNIYDIGGIINWPYDTVKP